MSDEDDMTAICDACCCEIDAGEVQCCDRCGRDGLGNCCIGELEHDCDGDAREP